MTKAGIEAATPGPHSLADDLRAKHTPGPWTVRQSKVPHDGEYDYAISAPGVPVLAEAFGRDADGGHPTAEANARLIAAAPDLLAALRRCAAILPQYHMKGKTLGDDEVHSQVTEDVADAIAKAEQTS